MPRLKSKNCFRTFEKIILQKKENSYLQFFFLSQSSKILMVLNVLKTKKDSTIVQYLLTQSQVTLLGRRDMNHWFGNLKESTPLIVLEVDSLH